MSFRAVVIYNANFKAKYEFKESAINWNINGTFGWLVSRLSALILAIRNNSKEI